MQHWSYLLLIHSIVVSALHRSSSWLQLPVTILESTRDDGDPYYPKRPGQRHAVQSLYHRPLSEQSFIGTHDAPTVRSAENNWSLSGNQYFNVSVQLQSGVRLIQAQGHGDPNGGDGIHLCHFNCALMDGGTLEQHLTTVRQFLDANPREVVVLLFVNTGLSLSRWMQAYFITGTDVISYIPPPWLRGGRMRTEDWPSPEQLRLMGKRLITFLSSGASENVAPYLLNQFDYMFETDFGIEAPDQYSCLPARPRWRGSYIPDRLSLVNHFLYAKFLGFRYPNATYANVTNGAGFRVGELGEHAVRCRSLYGRRPNFFLVDFYNEGSVFDVEEGMNKY